MIHQPAKRNQVRLDASQNSSQTGFSFPIPTNASAWHENKFSPGGLKPNSRGLCLVPELVPIRTRALQSQPQGWDFPSSPWHEASSVESKVFDFKRGRPVLQAKHLAVKMCKLCHGIPAVACVQLRKQHAISPLGVTQTYREAEAEKHINKLLAVVSKSGSH
jgi:hypothetical protein